MPKSIVRVHVFDLQAPESSSNPQQFDGSALISAVLRYSAGQAMHTTVVTVGEEMEVGIMLADVIRYLNDTYPGFTQKLMKTIEYNLQVNGAFIRAG